MLNPVCRGTLAPLQAQKGGIMATAKKKKVRSGDDIEFVKSKDLVPDLEFVKTKNLRSKLDSTIATVSHPEDKDRIKKQFNKSLKSLGRKSMDEMKNDRAFKKDRKGK